MKHIYAVFFIVLFAGCMSSDSPPLSYILGQETTTTEAQTTTTRFYSVTTLNFWVTSSTKGEPTTTLWVQPTSTTSSSTTTSTLYKPIPPTCDDGKMNQDERYVDCDGQCTDCWVRTLTGSWLRYKDSGYLFRFKEKRGEGRTLTYVVDVRNPDNLTLEILLSTGEAYVDDMRVKVINYDEAPDNPTVYLMENLEDKQNIPEGAKLITVGGRDCVQKSKGICERQFEDYTIKLLSRLGTSGSRVEVTSSEGVYSKLLVKDPQKVPFSDLEIGGLFERRHMMAGGYSILWVRRV